jgi:tetratricopeptide (TPR) repeat protein
MSAGSSRSRDRFAARKFTHQYKNQSHRDSGIYALLGPVVFSFLLIGCLFSENLAAQRSTPASVSPARYSVSAAELRVPAKAWSHLEAAHKEFSRGNLEKAELEVERALKIDSGCGPAFSMRAFIRLAEKNPSAALADATRATSIDAYDGDSFVALAMAYNSLKNFENASNAATAALALQPDSWQARLEMAKSLYGQGQFESALDALGSVAKDFPDVHLVRGNILMKLSRGQDAVREFTLFLREAPSDPRDEQVRRICATVSSDMSQSASVPR